MIKNIRISKQSDYLKHPKKLSKSIFTENDRRTHSQTKQHSKMSNIDTKFLIGNIDRIITDKRMSTKVYQGSLGLRMSEPNYFNKS
jgi:hypothetical protein